jgi:hypothetical protein
LVVAAEPERLREVIATLTGDSRAIFTRIGLDLLAAHPDEQLAAEWLGNEEAFRAHSFNREFAELAQRAFTSLREDVKERVIALVTQLHLAGAPWARIGELVGTTT